MRLMTPGIPDKKLVFLLTQSYYEQLLEAGVKIYEYQPGFLHAKSFVCDDKIGVVGTINLDYRSLYLHFEDGVWIYRNKVIYDIRQDFTDTLDYCKPVTLEFCRGRNICHSCHAECHAPVCTNDVTTGRNYDKNLCR